MSSAEIKNKIKVGGSYREMLALSLPKKAKVAIKYMEGLKWYIHWFDATDGEDCLYTHLSTRVKALKIVKENVGWELID